MDRSLDEIIAERPRQNRGRRTQGRRRDGVKKVLPPVLLSSPPAVS